MVKKSNCSLFENDKKKMTNIIFCPVVCLWHLNRKGWLVTERPAGRPVGCVVGWVGGAWSGQVLLCMY